MEIHELNSLNRASKSDLPLFDKLILGLSCFSKFAIFFSLFADVVTKGFISPRPPSVTSSNQLHLSKIR